MLWLFSVRAVLKLPSGKMLLSCASAAGLPVMGGEKGERMNIISELSCSQRTGPWNVLSLQPQAN